MQPGQVIRERRLANGLTQEQLALRAGSTQAAISRLERGQLSPTFETFERLLDVMGERAQVEVGRADGDYDRARLPTITTRRATLDDLDIIVADVQAGFDSYVAFAPEGWEPPDMWRDSQLTAELLADPATWALIADVCGEAAGHASFFPARERGPSQPAGRVAHPPADRRTRAPLELFIQPEWWGRGVAPTLHDAATAEMHARGFDRARLYTPSLHARAKRFYERRGWTAGAEEWNDYLALSLTEYWLTL